MIKLTPTRNNTFYRESNVKTIDKLNLKENENTEKTHHIEDESINRIKTIKADGIYSKLKECDYASLFKEVFNEKGLEDFEKNINNRNKEEKEKSLEEIEKEIKEEKEAKKERKTVEDKYHTLKIYLKLKQLYEEIEENNLNDEKFQFFVDKINDYENEEELFKSFDDFCEIIKENLYSKEGNNFSNNFFQNIEPKMLKFLIRLNMARIFFVIKKGNKEKIESIINRRNFFAKEILSNIIIKIIVIYREFINSPVDNKKIELHYLKNIYQSMIRPEGFMVIIKRFIEKEFEYFDILLDYINFEKVFKFEKTDYLNINKAYNIYEKYVYYYDGLSAFNNDNYSYITETKWLRTYDEEYEKWNKYLRDEYITHGLKIIYYLIESMYVKIDKIILYDCENKFYEAIFVLLNEMIIRKLNKKQINIQEIITVINGIIKIILADEENNFKHYLKYNADNNKIQIFRPIINQIKDVIKNYTEKENVVLNLIKEEDKENEEKKREEEEYFNSLILLLESFGEYKNKYLVDLIFEKNEENEENKDNNKTVFDSLVEAYEKILEDFKDPKEYDDAKKNKLIIFNSLTNCINEYIEMSKSSNEKEEENEDNNINPKIINNDDDMDDLYMTEKKIEKSKINEIIDNKIENLKIKNTYNIPEEKKNIIYDIFIIENHLQIVNNLIKNYTITDLTQENNLHNLISKFQLDKAVKQKLLFYESLELMNKCFKSFLALQQIKLKYDQNSADRISHIINNKSKNKGNIFEMKISDITDDVNNLYLNYKNNKLNLFLSLEQNGLNEINKFAIKNELLYIILLLYRKIFHLIKFDPDKFDKFKCFLFINDKDINIIKTRKIIDYFFSHSKRRLIILFSFLQKIHDIIEIKMNNQSFYQLNLLNPEYLDLSKNSMNYFSSLIDYESQETKLMTIYNYIECIIYDIKRKKWQQDEHIILQYIHYPQRNWNCMKKFAVNTYQFWEVLNLLLFLAINIYLIYQYSKSRDEEESLFNQIDNDQSFLVTKLWPLFHIALLIAFIIYWCFSRCKLEYFFSMTKYINEYFSEKQKLPMSIKVKLLNKEKSEFYLNNFFPRYTEEIIKNKFDESNYFEIIYKKISYIYVNYIKIFFYTTKMIYPFILSIICLCLSYVSQICFIIPVFFFFNLSETLKTIFLLFTEQSKTLLLISIFFIVILYIYSWIGFFFLPKMFKYEAVDKNNDLVSLNYTEESICSSTIPCILYFLNFGFRDNFMDQNLFSFKQETSYYIGQMFFNVFLYVFIHLIFDNIFLVLISNAFDDMKKKIDNNDEKKKNVCFICNKTRNDCIKEYKDFEEHLEKHDMWKYIRYISSIILKKRNQYSQEEYYVWKQIRDKKIEWFPIVKKQKEEEKEVDN